jgi:hypothetical protein
MIQACWVNALLQEVTGYHRLHLVPTIFSYRLAIAESKWGK